METNNSTKGRNKAMKVYGPQAERLKIKAGAKATGLSLSNYLLKVGAGYEPCTRIDREQIDRLMRINGDLGRLGGLLKLWLTDDARTSQVGTTTIRAVLGRVEDTLKQMRATINQVVRPRA